MSLKALNDRLEGSALAPAEIDAAFSEIMDGNAPHEEIKRFLTLTIPRMGDPAWIAGVALYVLIEKSVPAQHWLARAVGFGLVLGGAATLVAAV